jgi:hypothetical protein
LEWLQHFDSHTYSRTKGGYRLLILDGHESHHSAEFELYAKEQKIVTLCMPAHSSHRLQPLDVGCFGPLKTAYSRQIERLMKLHITHIQKEDFFDAFYAAFQQAITESNAIGGFRGSGLVPLDPDSVISKLDVVIRTPSPQPSLDLPNLWTSKTPTNPQEAISQSDFVSKKVSNHQNSSPTAIHKAIGQLSKGLQGTMHEVALLRTEVQGLREANSILSKRRRVKKQRLQTGGSLTAPEGRNIVAQRAEKADLRTKRRQDRAQQRGGEKRVTRCRSCGASGHNARNCKADADQAIESTIEVAN